MSLKTRVLARAVVVTLSASVLSACGGSNQNVEPPHGNPPAPPEEPVEPPPPPPEETPIPTNPPGPNGEPGIGDGAEPPGDE